jgi:hypothetical protein
MKKYIAILIVIFFCGMILPTKANAAGDFLKPTSSLFFLQSWGESIRLFFTFSKESKLNYLSHLNDKRISELQAYGSKNAQTAEMLAKKYEDNYKKIEALAPQGQDKSQIAEKIESNSIAQQKNLARVYQQVPEQAKPAILNAEVNSSKNVSAVLEKASPEKAQNYANKVQEIQKAQMIDKAEKVEKESGNKGGSPEGRGPKPLNSIKGGQELNKINGNNNSGGQGSQGRIQQAPMVAPAGQN